MIKPATNSRKTGHRPTNCNGSKSKSTNAKVWSGGASYSHQIQIQPCGSGHSSFVTMNILLLLRNMKKTYLYSGKMQKARNPLRNHGTFNFDHPENSLLTKWILFKEEDDPESTLF